MAANTLLDEAAQAYARGDLTTAAALGAAAAEADPRHAGVRNLLGLIAFGRADAPGAVDHLREAQALDSGNAEYANNLGVVLHAVGDMAQARPAFERALAIDPGFASAANNLGSVLEKLGDDAGAIVHYWRALELDPVYVEARDNLLLACARVAPQWHFPMIADAARNGAYAEALRRAAPGRRVLDIGSGTGLLAMLAARAGATHVTTCEMQPVIAALAGAVLAANGAERQVDLFSLRSDQLEVGRDLQQRAEVLVTETFSSGLLSEKVLPTVEDAWARLLIPEAVVLPRAASARGYLVGGPIVERHLFAAPWEGLDLSGFNLVAPAKLGLHLDRLPHEVLSEDFEIFGFDLARPPFPPQRRTIEVTATAAGRCVGVAQWIRLDLDETVRYENRPTPDAGANGWMHVVYRLAQPLDVQPGQTVRLLAAHNRTEIAVALAPDAAPG